MLKRGADYFVDHDVLVDGGEPGSDRQFTWGRSADRLHLGDVDGDQREDFVLRNGMSISISTDSVVAGGDHNTERRFSWGRSTDLLHLGDVTGDGPADLVLRRGRNYFVNDDAVLDGGDTCGRPVVRRRPANGRPRRPAHDHPLAGPRNASAQAADNTFPKVL